MLSSKDLIEQTGISRATLNNYIQLGLVPKPEIRAESGGGRPTRIGYFPTDTANIIAEISSLKKQGVSMSEIASMLGHTPAPTKKQAPSASVTSMTSVKDRGSISGQLSLDQVSYPAYLVNSMFELEWSNDAAMELLIGSAGGKISRDITERGIFSMLLSPKSTARASEGLEEMLSFHLGIAKNRIGKPVLLNIDPDVNHEDQKLLSDIFDEVSPLPPSGVLHTQVNLAPRGEPENWHNIYASFFREGIFFAYSPIKDEENALVSLLSRRDIVIRDLLKKRRPYLTPMSVVVADLQNSVKICAELPPEEYFELINDVWAAMEPILRKYYGTHGKHVGDGMVYYFFPQPDCNYLLNAIKCAHEMRSAMLEVSKTWQKRKNWLNVLQLNIGLVEGQEWFGTYQTPTHIEFTVLGDTMNMAGRLSDFARDGSIWITKNMLGKLSTRERDTIEYGIRRKSEDGAEIIISETFSRVSNLVDLDNPRYEKFRDIAVLAVAEVLDITKTDA